MAMGIMPGRCLVAWSRGSGEIMIKNRFIFLSLLSAVFLLSVFSHPVGASDLGAIKKPIPTATAEVINCQLEEGWCSKEPYVRVTGDDPTSTILAIEGSTNGRYFHFDGKVCNIPLTIGPNNLIFWSVSSSKLTSDKKYLNINLTVNQFRLLNNFGLIQKAAASLLPGRQLPDVAGNDLTDVLSIGQSGSSSTVVPDPKASLKTSSNIISFLLRRNLTGQKNASNLLNVVEEHNLVVDILPPSVNILPQQSTSGLLTFEGDAADNASGIKSLMVNTGQGWLPARLEANNHWTFQWNTNKAGISSGVFDFQVRAEDVAGNQTIQTQSVTILNRIWPILTVCALVLALGFTALADPRPKAWRALAQVTARAGWLIATNPPKEKR